MENLKPTFEHYFPENSCGGQCAAFAEKLFKFGPVGNTLASKIAYVKAHGSTNLSDIAVGDVLVTNESTTFGHVCIVNADLGNTWQVTESNYNLDEKVHHTRQILKISKHLKGHIRAPLLVAIITLPAPAPIPVPQINMNILLLKYKIPQPDFFNEVVDYALNWFKQVTGGEFVPSVSIVDRSDRVFTAVPTQNSQGVNINWIPPQQILDAASGVTPASKIICLCADYDEISPRPTYDEASGNIGEIGFLKTDQMQFVEVKAEFLVHEWLHIFYNLLNQAGVALVDDVHQHSLNGNGATHEGSFAEIILKLKPYWPILTGQAQGVDMSNAVFYHKVGTQEFGFAFPKTGVEALKDMAKNIGREDVIKPDGSVDFSKAKEVSGL